MTGLSADGRRVLLSSDATNFVAGDTDGATDVCARSATRGGRPCAGQSGARWGAERQFSCQADAGLTSSAPVPPPGTPDRLP